MKVAIIGAGKLGVNITEALLSIGIEVTLVDKSNQLLQKVSNRLDLLTINANAKNPLTLRNIKIQNFDHLIAVTGSDEKNMVICRFAKSLGCKSVIARVRDPEYVNDLNFIKESLGIDYIVNPDLSIANEIYKYLVEKYTLSGGIFTSGKVSILEFNSNKLPIMIDKRISNMGSILENMLIVAISRSGKVIIPKGDTVVNEGDILYIIGETGPIKTLDQIVHEKGTYTNLQKVMIVGGGKTGYYLAKKLSEFAISVKLIEIDKERCQYLSEHLDRVLILHGDATDANLLAEENLHEMDAFVTVTGFDEENLLLALMANQHDIEDVVAKISRKNYAALIEQMGVTMALNPIDISVTSILRFIQGSKKVLFSQMIQGQAEFVEILADKRMRLLNTPIENLNLPKGVIVAAIQRGDTSLIPNGKTSIQDGDQVIFLSLLSDIPKLEALF
ncbi:MAG: Trk system potassium transporter TrkA [Anaerovoracaceae bacterium]|jgi:trk system potassium uptake protein TrkA